MGNHFRENIKLTMKLQGRIQNFFKEGVVSRSRQTSQGLGNGGGGGGRGRVKVMFEYVDFLHFDFRGI